MARTKDGAQTHHYRGSRVVSLEQRFQESYIINSDTNCWEWQRTTSNLGYARFFYDHRLGYGHRYAWESAHGPIPQGLTLDHLCRNRRCVNPDHLETVTLKENLLRGDTPTARAALRTHCHQGHPVEPRQPCRLCRMLTDRRFRARHPGYRQRYAN